jgi:hypothetical protein
MSVSSQELRKLAALNLSPEQMSAVLNLLADRAEAEERRKAAQAEMPCAAFGGAGKSKGAERTARWRAKKAGDQGVTESVTSVTESVTESVTSVTESVTSVTESVTSVTPSPLVPPLEVSPTPPSKTPPIIPPSQPRAPDEFEAVDAALRKIEGLGNHPVAVDPVIGPIWQLVQQGYNLKTEIIPSIRQQIAKTRKRITRWGYFVPGIIEARTGPAEVISPAVTADWQKKLDWARRERKWPYSAWGPPPHKPGCRVPPAMLKPDDGEGWGDWRLAS